MKKLLLGCLFLFGISMAVPQDKAKEAIEKYDKVVVLFMKKNCPYSLYLRDVMDKVFPHYRSNNINYVVVEISDDPDFYERTYNFGSVPTAFYYKNGQLQARHDSGNKRMTAGEIQGYVKRAYGV